MRNNSNDEKRVDKLTYSVDEGAMVLGVSRPIMYNLCHAKDCPFVIRIGRRLLISRLAFEAWVNEKALNRYN